MAEPNAVLKVLADLRPQDRERRQRRAPETAEQRQFVRQWPIVQQATRSHRGGAPDPATPLPPYPAGAGLGLMKTTSACWTHPDLK
ncbi:MAG: hypothetical protein PHO07_12755, partial [Pirellulales bacterium]|nr:hypothetical protein [Pirellulales bacterium]